MTATVRAINTADTFKRKYVRSISAGVSLAMPTSILMPSATDETFQGSGATVGGRAGLRAVVITGVARDNTANFTTDSFANVSTINGGWPVALAAGDSFTWYDDGGLDSIKLAGNWRLYVGYK